MKTTAINQIVAVGSVDGICAAAALLHHIGTEDVGLVFTQAFAVHNIDISGWAPASRVAFVDLAVNNRDPKMTSDFVARIREAGHSIVAVCDEHSCEDWLGVLGSFEGLVIEPQSQAEGVFKSSGAILKAAFTLDAHGVELCEAADAGDRMDFTTHFGAMVNQAVKSDIGNDVRRIHLARHFAINREADETIQKWIAEYEEILANHDKIVAAQVELGGGIVRISSIGHKVDVTTLMNRLYQGGAKVVVLESEMFAPAIKAKKVMIAFGTNSKLDLLAVVKAAVPSASGFAQKANVELDDEAAALAAVRASM